MRSQVRTRFVTRPATGSRLLLRRPAGLEQESPIVADREAKRLVIRETSSDAVGLERGRNCSNSTAFPASRWTPARARER
jgi:hypothetical protein